MLENGIKTYICEVGMIMRTEVINRYINTLRASARRRAVGCLNTPLTRLLNHVATRGKRGIRKSVKHHDETASVTFWVKSKVRSPKDTKVILLFSTFFTNLFMCVCVFFFFYKSAHNLGTRRTTAPRKSAFDSSFDPL